MHYYKHNIGDFDKATRHLSRLERSIYRDLIELYYDTEQPLTLDRAALCRRIIARTNEEVTAVEQVLNEFFNETPAGWYHTRCEQEIAEYRANNSQKSQAGKASAAAKAVKRQQAINGCSTGVDTVVEQTNNGAPTKQETGNIKQYLTPLVSRADDVPVDRIVEAYNTVLGGTLPRAQRMTEVRRKHIKARWREMLGTTDANGKLRYADQDAGVEWFGRFFRKVLTNPHWTGDNDRGWTASLDWVMNPTNFTKILEYVPHDARKS